MYSYCRVIGCPNPASAGTDEGLNQKFCRKHEDFFERHGSYYKHSYKASEVKPYVTAILKWLNSNKDSPTVHRAKLKVLGLYQDAGAHIEAFRLRGLTPSERAKAAWARLRLANVDPFKSLASWLAIELMSLEDPQAENKSNFKHVQAAKLIHKMASGSHKRWEQVSRDGKTRIVELHVYPRSRGKILVHLGKQIEEACELLVSYHLDDLKSLTIKSPWRG